MDSTRTQSEPLLSRSSTTTGIFKDNHDPAFLTDSDQPSLGLPLDVTLAATTTATSTRQPALSPPPTDGKRSKSFNDSLPAASSTASSTIGRPMSSHGYPAHTGSSQRNAGWMYRLHLLPQWSLPAANKHHRKSSGLKSPRALANSSNNQNNSAEPGRSRIYRVFVKIGRNTRLIVLLLIVALISCFFAFRLHHRIPVLLEHINKNSDTSTGILTFIGVFIGIALVGVPCSVPALAAGFIFRPLYIAVGLVMLCTGIAGTLIFLTGKYLIFDLISKLEFVKRHKSFRIMEHATRTDGWKIALMLRLSQIFPFIIANTLLAMTPLPLYHFIWTTIVGTGPGLLLFIYIGSLLTDIADLNSKESPLKHHPRQYARMVILVSAVIVLSLVVITCIARRSWRFTVYQMTMQISYEEGGTVAAAPHDHEEHDEVKQLEEGRPQSLSDLSTHLHAEYQRNGEQDVATDDMIGMTDTETEALSDLESDAQILNTPTDIFDMSMASTRTADTMRTTTTTNAGTINLVIHEDDGVADGKSHFSRGERVAIVCSGVLCLLIMCIGLPLVDIYIKDP